LRKSLPVVFFIAVIVLCFGPVHGQQFSDIDTLSISGTDGYPGDTLVIPVTMVNTFDVLGFQFRFVYDSSAFEPINVTVADRGVGFDWFGADLNEPGVVVFSALSSNPRSNAIPPGSGQIAEVLIMIRNDAIAGSYDLVFQDVDFNSYNNYLTDWDFNLVVPIQSNGHIDIQQQTAIADDITMPINVSLSQNYPNPFNSKTVISFNVENSGHVDLDIYDITGRKVATLFSGTANPGQNSFVWDGRSLSGRELASGVFFCNLHTNWGESVTQRMVLIK